MIAETIDRRVLGAVRFLSTADDLPVAGPLVLLPLNTPPDAPAIPRLIIHRNRLGLHVIQSAPGFESYLQAFDPSPTEPPDFSRTIRIRAIDPSGRHFPTDFDLALPRGLDATPVENGFGSDTVFTPIDVFLFPSPHAPVADGWAVLRVLVWREEPIPERPDELRRLPVPGALVRVLSTGAEPRVLARSFTEWRQFPGQPPHSAAEAMIPVRGIPVTTWNDAPDGAVLIQDQPARLQVRFDTTFNPGRPDAPGPDLRRVEPPEGGPFPDGVIAAELGTPLTLRARLRETVRVVFAPDNQLRIA